MHFETEDGTEQSSDHGFEFDSADDCDVDNRLNGTVDLPGSGPSVSYSPYPSVTSGKG